ncbi:MAG: tRNA pseudouridine(38-40) synthase TruA [Gemmatimonadota bacterium]|nr:tRNA pseudouridine(38-40) synthase TruA [Gemmatimonadota bacterium]
MNLAEDQCRRSEETQKKRIRLTVAYDGTDYRGWQSQPEGNTIQDALEQVLKQVLAEPVRVTGAGRTDTGVHATGQSAHFDTSSRLGCSEIERALNALLPSDIRVRELTLATDDFHARYSATARSYRYCLAEENLPECVLLRRTHWVRPLRLARPELLHECAGLVAGEHDFFTFSKGESHRDHHLCAVYSAGWTDGQDRLTFEIRANRYLRRMIRMLLGAMLAVAETRADLEDFRHGLKVPGRMKLAVPAPGAGLTLIRVEYPDSFRRF